MQAAIAVAKDQAGGAVLVYQGAAQGFAGGHYRTEGQGDIGKLAPGDDQRRGFGLEEQAAVGKDLAAHLIVAICIHCAGRVIQPEGLAESIAGQGDQAADHRLVVAGEQGYGQHRLVGQFAILGEFHLAAEMTDGVVGALIVAGEQRAVGLLFFPGRGGGGAEAECVLLLLATGTLGFHCQPAIIQIAEGEGAILVFPGQALALVVGGQVEIAVFFQYQCLFAVLPGAYQRVTGVTGGR